MTLSQYIRLAMSHAHYRILEDKTYFGEISGFQGVWANEKNLEKCRETLQEVLEEWIVLKLKDGAPLPSIDGKKLKIPEPVHA